jgi:hypothetical protein
VRRLLTGLAATVAAGALALAPQTALADASKPGQSMTHIKTVPGIAPALESAGVILYSKGAATSGVIGTSPGSPDGQVVFHVPITSSKGNVKHAGSTLALFNTTNDQQVELRNPVIDLKAGVVRAAVGTGAVATVFTITNAKSLKPTVKKENGIRTTTYTGARLALAPGVAGLLVTALGLPSGAIADGAAFAIADVTLQSAR